VGGVKGTTSPQWWSVALRGVSVFEQTVNSLLSSWVTTGLILARVQNNSQGFARSESKPETRSEKRLRLLTQRTQVRQRSEEGENRWGSFKTPSPLSCTTKERDCPPEFLWLVPLKFHGQHPRVKWQQGRHTLKKVAPITRPGTRQCEQKNQSSSPFQLFLTLPYGYLRNKKHSSPFGGFGATPITHKGRRLLSPGRQAEYPEGMKPLSQ